MRLYKPYIEDAQYHCNIYMASYPGIFICIDIDIIDTCVSAPALTGSTLMLVKAALSSYNGQLIGLDDVFSYIRDDKQLKVLIMIMKIRAKVNKI